MFFSYFGIYLPISYSFSLKVRNDGIDVTSFWFSCQKIGDKTSVVNFKITAESSTSQSGFRNHVYSGKNSISMENALRM